MISSIRNGIKKRHAVQNENLSTIVDSIPYILKLFDIALIYIIFPLNINGILKWALCWSRRLFGKFISAKTTLILLDIFQENLRQ